MPTTYRPLSLSDPGSAPGSAPGSDLDSIATIHREACLIAYAFMGWSYSWQECRDWYAGKLPEWDWGMIAVVDGEAAGYSAGMGTHLDQLFVHPRHQGQGIGSGLMRAALKRTPPVETLHVFAENAKARRFYAQCGFREAGPVPDGGGAHPELVYRRNLP
ncbi:MAG: GNAT family N-acetyltransferase [Oceanibaculum nanhaiense]|uniref:GNAT family N-acetyltransferase n=1 Tax=Oceanibaculum nanhaiense TaxID=1909734 RepID=UPI0025A4329C|nr:GNAT family N-acetyltransferase [Oceanibaculum nanhaiense]MDM7945327.1 GNAT family N-acetyltransferase [Oceanibaculum nanhaiense]